MTPMPVTTIRFILPFPIHGVPPTGTEAKRPTPLMDSNGNVKNVQTTLRLTLKHHAQAPIMSAYGWQQHGEGTTSFNLDAKGLFAFTEATIVFDDIAIPPMIFLADEPVRASLFRLVMAVINDFIEWHTAGTGTLWTPRAAPFDIIGLHIETTLDDGQTGSGHMMGFDFADHIGRLLPSKIPSIAPRLHTELRQAWLHQWSTTFTDALREFWYVRPSRASALAAISIELYLAKVTSNAPMPAGKSDRDRTLQFCGETLVARLPKYAGTGLNSRKRFGDLADSWLMVVRGRNCLLHREQSSFEWRDARQNKHHINVSTPEGAAEYILGVARIINRLLEDLDS